MSTSSDNLSKLEKELKNKLEQYKTKQNGLNQLNEEIEIDKKLLEFYKYYNEQREILPNDLIPDDNRTAVIPPKDFGICATEYQELAESLMANLYDYVIYLTLKKNLIPFIKQIRNELQNNLSLTCLDAGCSIGGVTFRLAQQNDISSVFGIDLSPSFIKYAKDKQNKKYNFNGYKKEITNEHLSKITFLCQDASVLSQFNYNSIDIGFCSLVLHEMPHRVPMNILSELSRICKYVVVLDWIGPNYPWNEAGIRNRRIEYMAGSSHFNGFLHFVKLGGIESHIKSLKKYRNGIKIKYFKKIDQGTMGLYILDTTHAQIASKL